ncbi:hypothetical protein Dthio_PD3293 [Desulfonatronospira thiodismutans ASO3-1]|uniref:Uncharacterized protein n=1 Tax=Desulfonatronospira thiodismutans ASO3-1 TaxID=555779 RepID=D6SME3_9BACT|nr:hypothetical protein Dthio_PD3293 [Desulfonatronospira thiodismutans ASO3-1]
MCRIFLLLKKIQAGLNIRWALINRHQSTLDNIPK